MISPFIYGRLLGTPSGGVVYLNEQWEPLRLYALFKAGKDATRAIRVRRSISPAEQDFGFVGDELDTAGILAFCGAGDGFVTRIYDQSSAPVDAWNTNAVQQPYIVQSGVLVTENGKPAIRTPSGVRYLKINNGAYGTTGTPVCSELVVASSSSVNDGIVQYITSFGTNQGILIGGIPAYFFGTGLIFGGGALYVDSNIKTNNQHIMASDIYGTAPNRKASFFVNGTVYDNDINAGSYVISTVGIMGIGSGLGYSIIGEFQFYMSFTNSIKADIPALTEQLNEYYGTY
jgi:hypothetical protein